MQQLDSRSNDDSDTVVNRHQEVFSTQYSFAHLSGYPFYEAPVFSNPLSPRLSSSPVDYNHTPPPFFDHQQSTSNRGHARSVRNDGRTLSRRTTLCRHFMNNNHCPMKDKCDFIPDNAIESPEAHCWAFVQGRCRIDPCAYYHPRSVEPYERYTHCIACIGAPFCAFKHAQDVDVGKAAQRSADGSDTSKTREAFKRPVYTDSILIRSPLSALFKPLALSGMIPLQNSRQEQTYAGSYINGHGHAQTRNPGGLPSIETDGTMYYQQPPGFAAHPQ
ncbi:hypothetical protein CPB85DRAFT_1300649 [Mucidula mucida]|nr:hypothetical protein CPB85DRAFT_1300649 [Mucidula mucida]